MGKHSKMFFKLLVLIFLGAVLRSEIVQSRTPRIASGKDSKPNEELDYVILNVVFQNQMQRCGGTLIAPQYVLTSATCLYE